jgi:hypothetical protein
MLATERVMRKFITPRVKACPANALNAGLISIRAVVRSYSTIQAVLRRRFIALGILGNKHATHI